MIFQRLNELMNKLNTEYVKREVTFKHHGDFFDGGRYGDQPYLCDEANLEERNLHLDQHRI